MEASQTSITLDPASLTAFTATLSSLPKEEVRKAKLLFIKNAIADFALQRSSGRVMVIVMGCMSIIPIFLIVFIPAFVSYRKGVQVTRQKIRNAIEVWRDDLDVEADNLLSDLMR